MRKDFRPASASVQSIIWFVSVSRKEKELKLTSFVSHTSAPSAYITSSFWLPFPGAKRIFFTHPRCVGIPLRNHTRERIHFTEKIMKIKCSETLAFYPTHIHLKLTYNIFKYYTTTNRGFVWLLHTTHTHWNRLTFLQACNAINWSHFVPKVIEANLFTKTILLLTRSQNAIIKNTRWWCNASNTAWAFFFFKAVFFSPTILHKVYKLKIRNGFM